MKPHTAKSAVVTFRCIHRTPGGRQCRLSASDALSGLCQQHRAQKTQLEDADHYDYLIRNFQHFQTAQGINCSLGNLYELLAQNRISTRRAAVLSYISSLLLRTLPQIDADRAANIIDCPDSPTDLSPEDVKQDSGNDSDADSDANDDDDDDETSDLDSDSDSDDDSEARAESDTDAGSETEADSDVDTVTAAADTWDPSFPEPDPKKKPS